MNQNKNIRGLLRKIFLSKYAFVLVLFFAYLIFFDEHNLIQRNRNHREIQKLEQEYHYYQDKIGSDKEKIDKLNNDSAFLEKYAREEYHMKKDDEDIFIIKNQEIEN